LLKSCATVSFFVLEHFGRLSVRKGRQEEVLAAGERGGPHRERVAQAAVLVCGPEERRQGRQQVPHLIWHDQLLFGAR
jgi:hypothetical protein